MEHPLVWIGEQLGANWVDIRHKLQPFDTLMLVLVIGAVVGVHLVAPGDAGPRAARAGVRRRDGPAASTSRPAHETIGSSTTPGATPG